MRPKEKQNRDNQEKKVYRLTETKNNFSLLKDEMPNTIPRSADLKLQNQPKKEEERHNVIDEESKPEKEKDAKYRMEYKKNDYSCWSKIGGIKCIDLYSCRTETTPR